MESVKASGRRGIESPSATAGLWQKIIFHFTPEVLFAEVKSSERQKIEVKRLLAAANGTEGEQWVVDSG